MVKIEFNIEAVFLNLLETREWKGKVVHIGA